MTEALALTFQFTQADWKRVFMSVALRGLGNNAVNGGIDKRFKSPAFHAGVTGSNPVAVTKDLVDYPAPYRLEKTTEEDSSASFD